MRNRIIFENNRDHIVQVIQKAWMDKNLWEEATSLGKLYITDPPTRNRDLLYCRCLLEVSN